MLSSSLQLELMSNANLAEFAGGPNRVASIRQPAHEPPTQTPEQALKWGRECRGGRGDIPHIFMRASHDAHTGGAFVAAKRDIEDTEKDLSGSVVLHSSMTMRRQPSMMAIRPLVLVPPIMSK